MAACVPNAAGSVSNGLRNHAGNGVNTGQNGIFYTDLVVDWAPVASPVMFVRVSAAQMFRANQL